VAATAACPGATFKTPAAASAFFVQAKNPRRVPKFAICPSMVFLIVSSGL
jgi:hypothetical protein